MLSSMHYCKKSIVILLFIVFTQILMVNFSFASPVPVFCFYNFGFIKNSSQWNNKYKEKQTIEEYRAGSGFPAATYSIKNNTH